MTDLTQVASIEAAVRFALDTSYALRESTSARHASAPLRRVGDQSNDRDVSDRGLRALAKPVGASDRDLDSE